MAGGDGAVLAKILLAKWRPIENNEILILLKYINNDCRGITELMTQHTNKDD